MFRSFSQAFSIGKLHHQAPTPMPRRSRHKPIKAGFTWSCKGGTSLGFAPGFRHPK
jgi:hypothetical protein